MHSLGTQWDPSTVDWSREDSKGGEKKNSAVGPGTLLPSPVRSHWRKCKVGVKCYQVRIVAFCACFALMPMIYPEHWHGVENQAHSSSSLCNANAGSQSRGIRVGPVCDFYHLSLPLNSQWDVLAALGVKSYCDFLHLVFALFPSRLNKGKVRALLS